MILSSCPSKLEKFGENVYVNNIPSFEIQKLVELSRTQIGWNPLYQKHTDDPRTPSLQVQPPETSSSTHDPSECSRPKLYHFCEGAMPETEFITKKLECF